MLPIFMDDRSRHLPQTVIKKSSDEPDTLSVERFGSYRKGYAQILWITRCELVRLAAEH